MASHERFNVSTPAAPVGSSGQPIPGAGGIGGKQLKKDQLAMLEAMSRTLPIEMVRVFADLANRGILTSKDMADIMRDLGQAEGLDRKRLAKGLRGSLGKRLGPRSGAIDNLIANRVTAPSFGRLARTRADLHKTNTLSRLEGIRGLYDATQGVVSRYALEEEIGSQGPGFLDRVGQLAGIAETGVGIFTGNPALIADGVGRTTGTDLNKFGGVG